MCDPIFRIVFAHRLYNLYIQIYPCISPILDYIGQHTYTTDTGLPPYIAFSDPETAIPFERHPRFRRISRVRIRLHRDRKHIANSFLQLLALFQYLHFSCTWDIEKTIMNSRSARNEAAVCRRKGGTPPLRIPISGGGHPGTSGRMAIRNKAQRDSNRTGRMTPYDARTAYVALTW